MAYLVSIKNQGLETTSPSDGFIDPTTVEQYRSVTTLTGSKDASDIEIGQSFYINNVAITTTNTTLVSVVNEINKKSIEHQCFASVSGNKLVISNLPMYMGIPYIVDISEGISDKLGFVAPVKTTTEVPLPSTKALALAKVRANVRWEMVLESLQITSNINVKFASKPESATPSTVADSVEFVLYVPENYHSYDFSGNLVYGSQAIKFAIAKALMYSSRRYCSYFDPTLTDDRPQGSVTELVEIKGLTSDPDSAYDAVSTATQTFSIT